MMAIAAEEEDKKTEVQETWRDKLKRNVLDIYFELMRERNISPNFGIIMLLITTLQLIGYIYYRKSNFPFKDDLYPIIANVAEILRIYPAIESASSVGAYWTFQYLFLGDLVIYILSGIYVAYSITTGKFYFDFPVKIMRSMSTLFIWVLLDPYVEMFVSIFSCSNGRHIIDRSMECWTGIHIFYCFLFLLCLILFVTIGLLIAILYNESRPNTMDAFARLDTSLELYLFLYRVVMQIVTHFCISESFHWLLIVIHLLGSLNFVTLYLKYFPFYNSKISVTYGICVCSYFWTALNLLIMKLLENTEYTGQSIVIVVGIVIIIALVNNIRDKCLHRILFETRYDKLKDEYELDLYIKKVLDLLTEQGRNGVDELLLLGFVNNHKSDCPNQNCPIRAKHDLYLPATGGSTKPDTCGYNEPILVMHLVNSIYGIYSRSSNFSALLHICYSYFLFAHMGNIHMSIIELGIAEKMDITLQQMFTIYRNKKFIESYLVSKYRKKTSDEKEQRSFQSLDVTVVIIFENLYSKLLKAIEKSANEHIEFWGQLDSLLPDLNLLHKLGLNITTYSKQVEDIWIQLIKINPNHHKALRNYGSYLKDIRNDDETGIECIEKAKGLKYSKSLDRHMDDFSIMFADDTAIVVISAGNKESQGKITKTNTGITNLFKYNPLEVAGQDVSILMPHLIAAKHNAFLEKYFETGKEKLVNNERELFAMPRTGYVICISTIVKPVPSLKEDIQYIGLIRQRNKEDDYIITNMQGRIDSMSESLNGRFHFQRDFFKDNEVYVQFLCPELLNIEVNQDGSLTTALDGMSGFHELNFVLPRDFHSTVQGFSKNINVARQQTASEEENEVQSETANRLTTTNLMQKSRERLKLPDSVKRISQLVYGGNCTTDFTNGKNFLKDVINYESFEVKDKWVVEIKDLLFGDGILKLKVFRIMTHRSSDDATSEKFYGVKSSPSRTRTRPEEIERLKKVGLNPENRTSSSKVNEPRTMARKEETKGMDQGRNAERLQRKKANAEEIKKMSSQSAGQVNQSIQPAEKRELEITTSLTTITDIKNSFASSPMVPSNPVPSNEIIHMANTNEHVNPNDLSISLNASRIEDVPLVAPTVQPANVPPIRKFSSSKDQYMRKHPDPHGDEQEVVIMNLLKAKGDIPLGTQHIIENEEDKEGSPEKQRPETKKEKRKEEDMKNNLNDDVGSVASRTRSLMKHIRALRNAVYEQYCPRSVQQLKYVARFVFFVLLVITLVYFIIAKGLYDNLRSNVCNLYYSKDRLVYTTSIGMFTRTLMLIDPNARPEKVAIINLQARSELDYYKDGFEAEAITDSNVKSYLQWIYYCLSQSAKGAKLAQNGLSTSEFSFSQHNIDLINPATIKVSYKQEAQIAGDFTLDCWSAVIGLVIHALKIKDMNVNSITMDDPSVYYILSNSLNTILDKIILSTKAIQDESEKTANQNRTVLMTLLLVASAAIAISVVMIVRVTVMVTKNKEDILKLFIDIPGRNIKQQLNKCRRYFITFRDSDKAEIGEREMEIEDDEEDKKEGNKEEGENQEEDKKKDETAKLMDDEDETEGRVNRTRQHKKKKYKPYSTQLLMLILKFTFFVAILEGYFLASYLESAAFLSTAISLIMEIGTLSLRTFSNGFLYCILQEYIGTNGTARIQGESSETYVNKKIAEFVTDQEYFLKQHSDNIGINSDEYNGFFNNLIYGDACDTLFTSQADRSDCYDYPVLRKGLHSANIGYWDAIREIIEDFQKLSGKDRNITAIQNIFSDDNIIENERMQNRYFTYAYKKLLTILDKNLQNKFSTEHNIILILFIAYLAVLFILYFFAWNLFVESTRNSLWVTKCMLGIIPVNIILDVKNIKDFLINSSKSLMLNLGSD